MKMSDIFEMPVSPERDATWYGHGGADTTTAEFKRATAHAVNCHDDLVAALADMVLLRDQVLRQESTEDELSRVSAARAALAKARGEC